MGEERYGPYFAPASDSGHGQFGEPIAWSAGRSRLQWALRVCLLSYPLPIQPVRGLRRSDVKGLLIRPKKPRRHVSCQRPELRPTANSPDERWSTDFMGDELFDGRRIRLLTIVDNFARESPAIQVEGSIGGHQVVAVLARLALQGRLPKTIAVDIGPEFMSKACCCPTIRSVINWSGKMMLL